MASNDFSPASSSDSEVSEIEDYELEVEDSPNSSDQATDVEETQEAYFFPLRVALTIKRYWMKLNAFLLVSNVATAKYNTLLRHNFSSD